MEVTEWPRGQQMIAEVIWSNEASNSKLLLVGQEIQRRFSTNQTKLRELSSLHSIRIVFIKPSIVMTL